MSRVKLTLNGPWDFVPDPKNEFAWDRLPGKMDQIEVPGSWEGQFPSEAGVFGRAWYRKRTELPENWQGRAVFIHFGAVNYHSQVWVNGRFAGEHEGGYTPFSFRIDPLLEGARQVEIVVRVVHPAHATPSYPQFSYNEIAGTLNDMFGYQIGEIPLGKQNWYGSVSGIWQEVFLEAVYPTFFTQVLVTPDVDRSLALVRLGIHEPPLNAEDLALHYCIVNADGQTVGERLRVPLFEALGESACPHRAMQSPFVELPVEVQRLWSLKDPHLYRLEVRLEEKGQEQDSFTATFGMRKVSIRSHRIELNDEPLYMRGALDQDFYPETSYTPPSVEFLADQVDKAKHMGLNLLRCHIKAPDPRYLEVADQKGILVWEELPNWLRLTEESGARGRETLTRMIERDFNHPSTIIWTIINESWGADLVGKEWDRQWLKQMYHYVKRLDPTRLVVDNSPCNMPLPQGRNFHLRTDLEDYHIYFQIPDHYHKWNSWLRDFSRHPSWTFSPHGDGERTGEEPLLVSEFGNWGLPTLKDLLQEYGEEPSWFRTGVDITVPHGVQRRFDRLHLDDIFGSYDQFAIATQWQQYFALKHQIEQMRVYETIAGYVITEFTDLHWEANGLLNIWRRPKVFYHYLAQFQQDDVILADWNRLNFWEGDLCVVRVMLSHWSDRQIEGCTVEWNISELGVSGTFTDVSCELATSREVGRVNFVVPPLTDSGRMRLHLRLRDPQGGIIARNVQYVSFFPVRYRQPAAAGPVWVHDPLQISELDERLHEAGYEVLTEVPPSNSKAICLASRLDPEVIAFLEAGGRVLLLARSPGDLPAEATARTGLRIRDRRARIDENTREKNPWEGDWVSNVNWIKCGTVFEGIPRSLESPLDGDLMDMQYYRVIPNQVLLGWSQEREFPDVLAGMVVGWVHAPVALMAQCRWGRGRLLVTTLRLDGEYGDDPVATILLRNLVTYVAGLNFKPAKDALAPKRAPRQEVAAGPTHTPGGTPVLPNGEQAVEQRLPDAAERQLGSTDPPVGGRG